MESRKLSPATINRRLSALRSMVEQAGTLGVVSWELKIKGPKSQLYRDTAGPGTRNVRRMLELVQARDKTAKKVCVTSQSSDCSTIWLFEEEKSSPWTWKTLILRPATIKILGKGRTEKEILTLPQPTVEALSDRGLK